VRVARLNNQYIAELNEGVGFGVTNNDSSGCTPRRMD